MRCASPWYTFWLFRFTYKLCSHFYFINMFCSIFLSPDTTDIRLPSCITKISQSLGFISALKPTMLFRPFPLLTTPFGFGWLGKGVTGDKQSGRQPMVLAWLVTHTPQSQAHLLQWGKYNDQEQWGERRKSGKTLVDGDRSKFYSP